MGKFELVQPAKKFGPALTTALRHNRPVVDRTQRMSAFHSEAGIARQTSHIRNVPKSRHAKPAECRDPYQKENCLEAAFCAMGEATVSIILNSAFGVQAVRQMLLRSSLDDDCSCSRES